MLTYHESSIMPPIFRGRKLIPPLSFKPPPLPSLLLFFTNKCWTVLINHNRKTLCGLIRDGLFTSWKFGFVFDPWLHDLQGLVLKLSTLYSNHSIQTQFLLALPLRSGTMESGTK